MNIEAFRSWLPGKLNQQLTQLQMWGQKSQSHPGPTDDPRIQELGSQKTLELPSWSWTSRSWVSYASHRNEFPCYLSCLIQAFHSKQPDTIFSEDIHWSLMFQDSGEASIWSRCQTDFKWGATSCTPVSDSSLPLPVCAERLKWHTQYLPHRPGSKCNQLVKS